MASLSNSDRAKKAAAAEAINYLNHDMVIGLGTGSTANFFLELLGEKIRNGLSITAIPTSKASEALAQKYNIETIIPDETTIIDIAVDGADEIDGDLSLIKGGGGALFREKVIAQAAKKFIVIGDPSKKVAQLGAFNLPLEIDAFCWSLTIREIRKILASLGYQNPDINLRNDGDSPFLSDGGRLILDCALGRITDKEALNKNLLSIPGVLETGLFIGLSSLIILGQEDGTVETISNQ